MRCRPQCRSLRNIMTFYEIEWDLFTSRLRCANAALKHEDLTRKEASNGRGKGFWHQKIADFLKWVKNSPMKKAHLSSRQSCNQFLMSRHQVIITCHQFWPGAALARAERELLQQEMGWIEQNNAWTSLNSFSFRLIIWYQSYTNFAFHFFAFSLRYFFGSWIILGMFWYKIECWNIL